MPSLPEMGSCDIAMIHSENPGRDCGCQEKMYMNLHETVARFFFEDLGKDYIKPKDTLKSSIDHKYPSKTP